jgi:regulator of protease activity HflC (stomatin/prohibitin superfamily)
MNDYFKKQRAKSGGGDSGGPGGSGGGGGNGPRPPGMNPPEFMKNFGSGKSNWLIGIVAVVVLLVMARPFAIINSGEVGILVTLGKYEEAPLQPGFHVVIPFVQKVIIQDTRMRVLNYSHTELVADRRGISERPPISVLDSRGLPVEVEITIQYALRGPQAPATIAALGMNWEEKTINPNARDVVRSAIGNYTAEELPINRNVIATLIEEGMREGLEQLDGQPIDLIGIQLRGIVLPERIKEQIERVQIARQEAERARNLVEQAKQEALRKAEEARGLAEAERIAAQGHADRTRIEAEAQAKANELIARSLTPALLSLRQTEVQGKFNEALRENNDAKIFLTPGGAVPNIWVDTKDPQRNSSVSSN